jgi:hypothetical protein
MNIAMTALQGVTFYDPFKASGGYTLYAPMGLSYSSGEADVFLIDMEGHICNRWRMPYMPGMHGFLLPNGNLIYSGMKENVHVKYNLPFSLTGYGGNIVEQDWDGNTVRTVNCPRQSHDFTVTPDNHVMYITYGDEKGILPDEITARWRGGVPEKGEDKIYGDNIYEVDDDGKIIWEWISYEHLDPEIDAICPLEYREQWHINTVFICRDGNILISPRQLNEILKIEYPGGKVLGRWGRGKVFHQHDPRELDNGNILLFDNGTHRHSYWEEYSRVVEIDPKTDEIVWEYKAPYPPDFFSQFMGGAERQPNGNTVICDSCNGRIFEVTHDGEMVWEYVQPFRVRHAELLAGNMNHLFRAHRYPSDWPGLRGKDLDPARFPWENRLFGPGAFRRDFAPVVY